MKISILIKVYESDVDWLVFTQRRTCASQLIRAETKHYYWIHNAGQSFPLDQILPNNQFESKHP